MKQIAALLCALALCFVTGCGSSSSSGSSGAAKDEPTSEDTNSAAAQQERAQAAAKRKNAILAARYRSCSSLASGMDTKLNDLNSRLSVGLSFDDYSEAVGAARVAYDRMFKRLGKPAAGMSTCLTKVLVPLEASMNTYASAYNDWNDCIGDYNCTMEGEKETALQTKWAKAGKQLARADRGLMSMNPGA